MDENTDLETRIQQHCDVLRNGDLRARIDAALALGQIGRPAVGALIEVFNNPSDDWQLKWQVVNALGMTNDPRAIEPLISALSYPDDLVAKYAAYGLARFRDARAVEPLIAVLSHDDGYRNEVACAAAEALGEIGDERALGPVFDAMVNDHIWTPEALEGFGEVAVHMLVETLDNPDGKRRSAAASLLGEMVRDAETIHNYRIVERLIEMVENEEEDDARWSAAFALGYIGDQRAIDSLVAYLENVAKDWQKPQIRHALARMGHDPRS